MLKPLAEVWKLRTMSGLASANVSQLKFESELFSPTSRQLLIFLCEMSNLTLQMHDLNFILFYFIFVTLINPGERVS